MEKIVVNDGGIRIDTYLADKLNISRSKVAKMLENNILVNNVKVKPSYKVTNNDIIEVEDYVENFEIKPLELDLDIVYEDDDVLVVNKPNGLVVHPAVGHISDTLVNALMHHCNLSEDKIRPGIVHRIDADTTGLLMVAKNNYAHDFLAKQLEEKTVTRKYYAIVWGVIKNDTGTIDAPIGRSVTDRKKMCVTSINSKSAITHFKVLERYKRATLIELKLETGRTHQIRVHMDYIGHPVVNDPVYGRRKLFDETGQCLHAKELGFIHPKTGEYMHFDSELPSCFINILNKLKEE